MESFRIGEKNLLNNKIRELNIYLERNKETITRFSCQSQISKFELKQIEKIENKNNEYEEELKKMKDKIVSIDRGELDSEYKESKVKSTHDIQIINEKIKTKRVDREEKEVEKKKFVQTSYDINRTSSEFHMNKDLQRFYRNCSTIPPYMKRNLKEMPNNKGYIFKGVHCYGELPKEKNSNHIMFEKCYNDLLRIHETDEYFTCVYEKIGKGRKTFISKTERPRIVNKFG